MNLKELAETLGVSQTTVSRALGGYPEVSEATRARVMAAAEQYNYRPSSRARALATGRAFAIGHVIPVSSTHEMVNPIFADFIAGAGETYSANGVDMLLSVVSDAEEERAYRELAAKRNVDGVIVHAPRGNDPRPRLLRGLGLPFIVHGRTDDPEDSYTWLDVSNMRAFYRATRLLLDMGHRRIALINGLETMDFAKRRRAGYLAALEEADLTPDPDLMAQGEMTEPLGHSIAGRLLDSDQAPTAFLVSSYILALGVRRALSDRGLAMGRDVSVITHDDDLGYLSNAGDVPVFTATRSSVRQAGRVAAQMLLDRINTPDAPHTHQLWEADLRLGTSTGPAPTSLTS